MNRIDNHDQHELIMIVKFFLRLFYYFDLEDILETPNRFEGSTRVPCGLIFILFIYINFSIYTVNHDKMTFFKMPKIVDKPRFLFVQSGMFDCKTLKIGDQ